MTTATPTSLTLTKQDDGLNIAVASQATCTFAIEVSGDGGSTYHRSIQGLANPLNYKMRHMRPDWPYKVRVAATASGDTESAFCTAVEETTNVQATVLNFGRHGALGANGQTIATYWQPRMFKNLARVGVGWLVRSSTLGGGASGVALDPRADGYPATIGSSHVVTTGGINFSLTPGLEHVKLPVTLRVKYSGTKRTGAALDPVWVNYNGAWTAIPASGTDIVVTSLGSSGTSIDWGITSTNPADPIHAIEIYEPAFEGTLATDPWHSDYKAIVARNGWLRAMDFKNTNGPSGSFGAGGDELKGACRVSLHHTDHVCLAILARVNPYQNAAQTTIVYPAIGDVFVGDVSGNTGVYQSRLEARRFRAGSVNEGDYNNPPAYVSLSSPSGTFTGDTKITCAATGCVIFLFIHKVFSIANIGAVAPGNPTVFTVGGTVPWPVNTLVRLAKGGRNAIGQDTVGTHISGWSQGESYRFFTFKVLSTTQLELQGQGNLTGGVVTLDTERYLSTSYYDIWFAPVNTLVAGELTADRCSSPNEPTWSELITLSNQTSANLYVCLPTAWNAVAVEWLLTLIKDTLDKRLICAIERSNEIWNSGFLYTHGHFSTLSREMWLNGLSTFHPDPGSGLSDWYDGGGNARLAYAYQALQDAALANTVFAGQTSRIRNVLADQNGSGLPGWVGLMIMPSGTNAPMGVSGGNGTDDVMSFMGMYAVAPYSDNIPPPGAPADITDSMISDLTAAGFVSMVAHAAYANAEGKEFGCYEGGQQMYQHDAGTTGPQRVAWGKDIDAARFQDFWNDNVLGLSPKAVAICHYSLYQTHFDGINTFMWGMIYDARHRVARFEEHAKRLFDAIPAAPVSLTFTDLEPDGFRVNLVGANASLVHEYWTRVEGAAANDWILQGTTIAGVAFLDLAGLTDELEYDIAVCARGTYSPLTRSPYTNDSYTVTSDPPSLPSIPTGVSAAPVAPSGGNTPVAITFTEGADTDTIEIEQSLNQVDWGSISDDATSVFSYTAALGDVTHYFRVRGRNAEGVSAWVLCNALAYPAKPAAPVMTRVDENTNSTPVAVQAGRTYQLLRKAATGGAFAQVATGAGPTLTDTTCTEDVANDWRVTKTNASGVSEQGSITEDHRTLPAKSTSLVAIGTSEFEVTITWVENAANAISAEVYVADEGSTDFTLLGTAVAGLEEFVHTGLDQDAGTKTYYVKTISSTGLASLESNEDEGAVLVSDDPTDRDERYMWRSVPAFLRLWVESRATVKFKTDASARTLQVGTAIAFNTSSQSWVPWVQGGSNGTGNVRSVVVYEPVRLSATHEVLGLAMFSGSIDIADLIDKASDTSSEGLRAAVIASSTSLRRLGISVHGLPGLQ